MTAYISTEASTAQLIQHFLQYGEWTISVVLLFVVAWARFNSPPTNRSGTTFAMFFFGVIFYFALIIALWLLVIIMVNQGLIGLSWLSAALSHPDPEVKHELNQFAPLLAALFIVVASQFPRVGEIDAAARSFCVNLAAIPREADRLGFELSRSADFQPPSEALRNDIEQIVHSISPSAVRFEADGSVSARLTRAIGLYQMFITPMNNKRFGFPLTAHTRSAYIRILHAGQDIAARASSRYEDLIQVADSYFNSSTPANETRTELDLAITEVSTLTCSLIARYALFCDMTRAGRRHRLSGMGFDARHPMPEFGLDKWALTIFAVMLISMAMMRFGPGMIVISGGQILTIAITFAITIGFATMGAIVVARRFIERRESEQNDFPPIGELALAALIVAGLSMAVRIAIPLVPALITVGGTGLQDVMTQFVQRLPGLIIPFTCTISLGLLCSYLCSLNWSWYRVSAVGAVGNGLAFMAAAVLVGWMISDDVLRQFYQNPSEARPIIVATTGITGAIIGAMVLAIFRRSERIRKAFVERVAQIQQANSAELLGSQAPNIFSPVPPHPHVADRYLGGYAYANVQELEGLYLCFRPGFTSTSTINAYLIDVRWDDVETCLVFEERNRIDAGHTQKGRVYVPDGKPFISLVTVEKGAIRLIMVSRPDEGSAARGIITTLHNPATGHFTPACAPIVLRRVSEEVPQLGFIQPDVPAYSVYRRELEAVIPEFGFFVPAPQQVSQLSVVN
jgi:hypothetical protein